MHRIRLRGPWEHRPADQPELPTKRLKLPADWASVVEETPSDDARFEFRRSFHMPTGISPQDDVFVVLQELPNAVVTLNGKEVGKTLDGSETQFAICGLLMPKNELTVVLPLCGGQACEGEVSLAIG